MIELTLINEQKRAVDRVLRISSIRSEERFLVWYESDGPGGETCADVTEACFNRLADRISANDVEED